MSARISRMYKLSGGCNTGHHCFECRYYAHSKERKREFICKKHGEEGTYWNGNWLACKSWRKPVERKEKIYRMDVSGQLQMMI